MRKLGTEVESSMQSTIDWLLDREEPGVRAQALVLFGGHKLSDPEVKEAQSESLIRGATARVRNGLAPPSALDNHDNLFEPRYGANCHRLIALVDMKAPSNDERIDNVLESILILFAKSDGGFGRKDSHVCITGNIVRAALHFGRGDDLRVTRGVEWLLRNQHADGGWNCFPEDEPGSTVDTWEPLAALGTIPIPQRSPDVQRAIDRGVEFLLSQRLGVESGYEPWRRIHFPRHYYYDFLLGLELVTSLGDPQDPRLKSAFNLLLAKSLFGNRWILDITHPDVDPEGDPPYKQIWEKFLATVVRLEVEPAGIPSRWATLAASRVLLKTGSPT
jgi:hypothetical protein